MRQRGSVVIIEKYKVALIRRERNGSVYFVFPGGGVESGESPAEAAKREAFEELGVTVQVHACIANVDFDGMQYYFLADILGGAFGTGQGEEFLHESRFRGTYKPVWIDIEKLAALDVRPKEVALKIESL